MQKKILVLVSNPKGTTNLELLPEINKLKEALRRSVNRERFIVEWEVAVRQTDLRRHILDVKPQIIHFCGHGTEQGLVLGDETGRAKLVPNEVLTDLLRAFSDLVECVVLNACDLEPLADDLVQHLNYVIGMNQEVRDDAAIAFAEGFYDTLGAGESYERAFEIGKNAVLGKATLRHAPDAPGRKATVVGQDGKPVKVQNREHLIPVLKINPNPTPIKPLWLAPEVERQVVRDLLKAIESGFNTIKLFHTDEAIVLKDQYIPVQVTLERRYKHSVETIGGYAESEAELRRIYAMKGSSEEKIEEEIKRQQVDWEEARRQHSRIVVLADPGMGKSTLLRREVVTIVQQAYQALAEGKPVNDIIIPLFIRLSTLADEVEKMPTGEAILKIIQERHFTLLKEHENAEVVTFLNVFLKKQLLNGKALLLLDALDEVPDGKRQKLLEKLNEFAKGNQTNPCPIVGTSRIVGYGGRLVDGAKDVEIVPFTQKQTEEYIEKWFEYAPLSNESVSARGLIQALRERPQIAGLAQNPLLLSLICSLYQQDYLTLPVRRCQLYEQAVNYMLGQWSTDNERQSANEGWILAKKELLEELAYQFSCESKQLFSFGELRKKLEKYLKSENASTDLEGVKAADLIKQLCEQDGILQRWTAEDDRLPIERRRYLFLHRTFQEYLTASYLSRVDEDEIEFEKLFWNYDWHETISLMAGLMYEPSDLIQRIINTKDDIFQTQLLLAGRCIAECGELSDPLVDEIIDRICQFWLTYPNAEFIHSVVVAIGQAYAQMIDRIAQLRLASISGNEDNSYFGKVYAIKVLGRISNSKAIDILCFILYSTPTLDTFDKNHVIEALGQIDNNKAVNALIPALNDDDALVRRAVITTLAQMSSESAIDALTSALDDVDSYARNEAVIALGNIDDEKSVTVLSSALDHWDSDVRWNATAALGGIRSDKATNTLIAALKHTDRNIRCKAAEGLRKRNEFEALLLNSIDLDIQQDALKTVSICSDNKDITALIKSFKTGDVELKKTIVNSLFLRTQVDSEENSSTKATIISVFLNCIEGESGEAQILIATALGLLGVAEVIPILISAIDAPDRDIRQMAVNALIATDSIEAIPALIHALNNEDEELRMLSVTALGKIGKGKHPAQAEVISALIAALYDEDATVRGCAALSLGSVGGAEVISNLMVALRDEDSNVRIQAVLALGQIGGLEALPALITALNDEEIGMRYMAALALGQVGYAEAIPALNDKLHDSEVLVRIVALVSLIVMSGSHTIITLATQFSSVPAETSLEAVANFGARLVVLFGEGIDQDCINESISNCWLPALLARFGSTAALPSLINALNDEEPRVRILASLTLGHIGALGHIGDVESISALTEKLNDSEELVQVGILVYLTSIDDAEALKTLRKILNTGNENIRKIAITLLGTIQNPDVLPILTSTLHDEDSDVRLNAVLALQQIKSDEVVPALTIALKDECGPVRDAARKALIHIGSIPVIRSLADAIKDKDHNMRTNVIYLLQHFDDEQTIHILIGALKDESSYNREIVVRQLGDRRNFEAIEPLITALSDEDTGVRKAVVQALKCFQNPEPEVVRTLATALQDENWYVRFEAARALQDCGNLEVLPSLIAALNDDDSNVQRETVVALGNIGGIKATRALAAVLKDKDFRVREQVVYALESIASDEAILALIHLLENSDRYSPESMPALNALRKMSSIPVLSGLLQSSNLDIYQSDIFFLIRSLALRFHKANLPFIPIYPEVISACATVDKAAE